MPDNECLAPLDRAGVTSSSGGGEGIGDLRRRPGIREKNAPWFRRPIKKYRAANCEYLWRCCLSSPSSLSLPETNTVIVFALSLIFEIFFFLEIEISCYKCFDINYGFEDRIIVILIRFN